MPVYGFKDKQTAQVLKQVARERTTQARGYLGWGPTWDTWATPDGKVQLPGRKLKEHRAYIVVAQSIIPGATVVNGKLYLGVGTACVYRRNQEHGTRIDQQKDEETSEAVKVTVYNFCPEPIEPIGSCDKIECNDAVLFVVQDQWGDLYIVEKCPVGEGSSVSFSESSASLSVSGPPSASGSPSGSPSASGPPSISGSASGPTSMIESESAAPSGSPSGPTLDVLVCPPYIKGPHTLCFPQKRVHYPPGTWFEDIPETCFYICCLGSGSSQASSSSASKPSGVSGGNGGSKISGSPGISSGEGQSSIPIISGGGSGLLSGSEGGSPSSSKGSESSRSSAGNGYGGSPS